MALLIPQFFESQIIVLQDLHRLKYLDIIEQSLQSDDYFKLK